MDKYKYGMYITDSPSQGKYCRFYSLKIYKLKLCNSCAMADSVTSWSENAFLAYTA